jgi:hypothetical protein
MMDVAKLCKRDGNYQDLPQLEAGLGEVLLIQSKLESRRRARNNNTNLPIVKIWKH